MPLPAEARAAFRTAPPRDLAATLKLATRLNGTKSRRRLAPNQAASRLPHKRSAGRLPARSLPVAGRAVGVSGHVLHCVQPTNSCHAATPPLIFPETPNKQH